MPAADTNRARRSARLLPTALFWTGVGLAPLAVLLFLVSSGTFAMQIASVLAIVALAMMGVALWLRRDGASVRAEVEEIFFAEIGAVRGEIRNDIAHATRTSHQALGDRIVALNETVEALRGQLDYVRGQLDRGAAAQPSHQAAPQHHGNPPGVAGVPAGMLRHTETVHVTTRQTTLVDSADGRRDGTVYGGRPQNDYGQGSGEYGGRARVDFSSPPDTGVPSHFGGRATVPPRPEPGPEARPEPRPEPWPEPRPEPWPEPRPEPRTGDTGVPSAFGGRSYGAAQVPLQRQPDRSEFDRAEVNQFDQGRSGPARFEQPVFAQPGFAQPSFEQPRFDPPPPAIDAGPREESWTEQLLRERLNRRDSERVLRGEGQWGGRGDTDWAAWGEGDRTSGGRRRADDPDDHSGERTTGGLSAAGTTGYRTADRWAEVRSDERGRELQMGERRSQMREGERGSEIRIEDRWAAVRREDDRRQEQRRDEWGDGPRRSPAKRERERDWSTSTDRREVTGANVYPAAAPVAPVAPAALPASAAAPTTNWSSGWADAGRDDPEPTGRRRFSDDPELTSRRRREEDEAYRWNDGHEPDGRTPRRIVDFEHTDDRWR